MSTTDWQQETKQEQFATWFTDFAVKKTWAEGSHLHWLLMNQPIISQYKGTLCTSMPNTYLSLPLLVFITILVSVQMKSNACERVECLAYDHPILCFFPSCYIMFLGVCITQL